MATPERTHSKSTQSAKEQRMIPVWKSTRNRAREVKGGQSYNELISTLLDRYESETE